MRFHLHMAGPSISGKQLSNAIRSSMLSIYGEVAVADSRFFLSEYDETSGHGILQSSAGLLEKVITSAVLLASVESTQVSFQPSKTSGTIRSLKR